MVTTRTGYATVRNNTSQPLLGVSLVHKYSDEFKEELQWGLVQPGEAGEEHLAVQFNTGFMTTGRDWWLVTWFSPDMKTILFSDPNNFRDIVDGLETLAPDALAAAAGAVAGLGGSFTGPGAIAAATAAAVAAKAVTTSAFNDESTDGFKQHILREEDEGTLLEIVINDDATILIKSPSGESETVYSTKAAPLPES